MPLYEFHCNGCGADSEVLVRGNTWNDERCPTCGAARLVKKLSVFAAGKPDSTSTPCGGDPSACCGGGMCGMGG